MIADWLQPPCFVIGGCREKGIIPSKKKSPYRKTHLFLFILLHRQLTLDASSSFKPESQTVCGEIMSSAVQ